MAAYQAKYLADWTSGEGAISYELFLQQKEFERSNLEAINAQTQSIVGSNEQVTEVLRGELSSGFGDVNRAVAGLRSDVEDVANAVRETGEAINTALYWGFSQLLESQGRLDDSLQQLVALARTPSQTWALEQFEIARNNEQRLLFPEAVEAVTRAIEGHASNIGHKTEFRFHVLLGKLRLGNFQNSSSNVVAPQAAEKSFLDGARYARAEFPAECGAALICAGRAAHVQREFARAIEHTKAGLELVPKNAHGHYQLARLLCVSGQMDEARSPLARAIRYLPELSIAASREPDFASAQTMVRGALADATKLLVSVLNHKGAEFNAARRALANTQYADQTLAILSADKLALMDQIARDANQKLAEGTVLSVWAGIQRLMTSRGDFESVLSGFKSDLLHLIATKEEAAAQAANSAIARNRRERTQAKDEIDGKWNSMTVMAVVIGVVAVVVALVLKNMGSILVIGGGLWLANTVLQARRRPYGELDRFEARTNAENANLQQVQTALQRERFQIEQLRLPPTVGMFSSFSDDPPPAITEWLPEWGAAESHVSAARKEPGRSAVSSSTAAEPLLFAQMTATKASRAEQRKKGGSGTGAAVAVLMLLIIGGGALWLVDPFGWRRAPVEPSVATSPSLSTSQAAVRADDEAWSETVGAKSRAPFDVYLSQFPNGRHIEEAKSQIASFDKDTQLPGVGQLRSRTGESFFVEAFQPSANISVRGVGARFREAPFATDETPILGVAQPGYQLSITGRATQSDGTWYQVRISSGAVAYIRADLTSSPVSPEPPLNLNAAGEPGAAVGDEAISPTPASREPAFDKRPVRHRDASLPDYPAASEAAKEEGKTTLSACVQPTGRVTSVTIAKSSGFPRLDAAAATWLEKQIFDPATIGSVPAEFCGYSLEYEWKLKN